MTNTENESKVKVSTSEKFEKVLSKITLLENADVNVAKAESNNAKIKHL